MTSPVFAECLCGHNKLSHEVESAPGCCRSGCACTSYRPAVTGATRSATPPANLRSSPPRSASSSPPAPSPSATIAPLARRLQVLTEHADKRIARLATKLHADLEQLEFLVAEFDARAQDRAEVRRLEAELAQARSRLTSRPVSLTPAQNVREQLARANDPAVQSLAAAAHLAAVSNLAARHASNPEQSFRCLLGSCAGRPFNTQRGLSKHTTEMHKNLTRSQAEIDNALSQAAAVTSDPTPEVP